MSQLALQLENQSGVEDLFGAVFNRLHPRRRAPEFRVEFRAFAGLRSQILVEAARARVRISDVLETAPAIVLEALAEILLSQVYRRRPSREARECYLAYVCHPDIRSRIDEARRRRARLRLAPPKGDCYNLSEIFSRLNRRYFEGRIEPCRIGWSLKAARTILGRYDPAHQAIIISRALDSPRVPGYVVEYLVFHEMLHIRFPVERNGERRVVHSREFRKEEKNFPHYRKAKARLRSAFA